LRDGPANRATLLRPRLLDPADLGASLPETLALPRPGSEGPAAASCPRLHVHGIWAASRTWTQAQGQARRMPTGFRIRVRPLPLALPWPSGHTQGRDLESACGCSGTWRLRLPVRLDSGDTQEDRLSQESFVLLPGNGLLWIITQ